MKSLTTTHHEEASATGRAAPARAGSARGGVQRMLALALPAALATGLLATRWLSAAAERSFPALGQRVDVGGLAQHVLVRGDGPPVVFVHGAFGALQDFSATILDQASRRYRCVAWDRPGHGYSERPGGVVDPGDQAHLLAGLIDELGLERPLLVGFSYGGAVVLATALDHPESTRGIVLLNTPTHPWPGATDFSYRLPAYPLLGWLATECMTTPLGALARESSVERAFAPLPVPASFQRSPIPLALRPASFRANAQDMRVLKPYLAELNKRYGELTVPATVVVARGDRVVSPTLHGPQLCAVAPRARLVEVQDAGHQLLYTHGQLVLDVIDAALSSP